jgi:indolepyruvate ferredoxin oxidoreductase
VGRIAVVSDHPEKYARGAFPSGVTVHHRDALDAVQRELREVTGVSAMVYDQTCAAEARRLRKQGAFPDPDERIVINEAVCEGCGDCSVQSNCISIEPVETELGRKRRINQSSCNKDYSCLKGLCPSFVSVHGGRLRKTGGEASDTGGDEVFAELPDPSIADTSRPFNVLVTGIGGSGVVTVGALLGMAAHLEGKGASELDVTGLAQKNGPVTSHVRIAASPEDLHATRIAGGSADLVLGCDIVVTSGAENLSKMGIGRTTAVVNQHVAPTSDFASNPDLDLGSSAMEDAVRGATGPEGAHFVHSTRLATAILGDAIASNLFLVGYALQLGRIPVSLAALERAIELNGRGVEMNRRALRWGRLAAHDPEAVARAARPALPATARTKSIDELVDGRASFLTRYQNARYARRYRSFVERVGASEARILGERGELTAAVARYYFKLLAYKDEYEVARLFTDGTFQSQLDREFEGEYTIEWHPAPPHIPLIDSLLKRRDERTGRTKKVRVGSWAFKALGVLARFKFLRGTPLDPFGVAAHRKLERQLIRDYEATVAELLDALTQENRAVAVEIASIPDHIRGFDVVKEEQLENARTKQADLLATFHLQTPGPAHPLRTH